MVTVQRDLIIKELLRDKKKIVTYDEHIKPMEDELASQIRHYTRTGELLFYADKEKFVDAYFTEYNKAMTAQRRRSSRVEGKISNEGNDLLILTYWLR